MAAILAFVKFDGASQCSAVRVQLVNLNGAAVLFLLVLSVCTLPFESLTVTDWVDGAMCRARPVAFV